MSTLTPEKRLEKLNKEQDLAVLKLEENNFNGTVILPTGFGKSWVKFKVLKRALDLGILNKGDDIWILAEEVKVRKKTIFEELDESGIDLSSINIKFYSYNIGPKYKDQCFNKKRKLPVIILCDESECMYTEKFHKTLLLSELGVKFCGFSATRSANNSVFRSKMSDSEINFLSQSKKDTINGKVTDYINKGQLADIYMPVVHYRDFEWGISEGLLSPFETIIIEHELSNKIKNKGVSEKDQWDKWLSIIDNESISPIFKLSLKKHKMPSFLYDLQSKKFIGRKLVELIEKSDRKAIIFAKYLDFLKGFTNNVVEKHNALELVDKLNKGEVQVLGSSKRLQRGVTIKGLDTLVIFLKGKSNTVFTQMLGRLIRYQYKKVGLLIIIKTKDTYEDNWIDQINIVNEQLNDKIIKKKYNLNIIKTINSKTFYKYVKSL